MRIGGRAPCQHSLPARALALSVAVGAPAAVGMWLLVRPRHLWRASMDGPRQP